MLPATSRSRADNAFHRCVNPSPTKKDEVVSVVDDKSFFECLLGPSRAALRNHFEEDEVWARKPR
jgi:hypothetical protein